MLFRRPSFPNGNGEFTEAALNVNHSAEYRSTMETVFSKTFKREFLRGDTWKAWCTLSMGRRWERRF
jgi:hypothetical protein